MVGWLYGIHRLQFQKKEDGNATRLKKALCPNRVTFRAIARLCCLINIDQIG
jgi:hypothetical protein